MADPTKFSRSVEPPFTRVSSVEAMEQCSNCAKTLNGIAKQLADDLEARKAISFAKNALLFVAVRHCMEFQAFLEEMHQGLPPEKELELKLQEIDLDSKEADSKRYHK